MIQLSVSGNIISELNTRTYNNARFFDAMRSCKESIHAETDKIFTHINTQAIFSTIKYYYHCLSYILPVLIYCRENDRHNITRLCFYHFIVTNWGLLMGNDTF